MKKRLLKIIAVVFAVAGIILANYYLLIYPKYTVPVLMYHYIKSGNTTTLSVSPENFEKQMKYLRDKKYDVISLDDLINGINSGRRFSHKTVVITFDDGTADNYIYAFPTLYKYRIPATSFLITSKVGKYEEFLNWDQVRLMSENGIEFGAHTRTHPYLPSIDDENKLKEEIMGSKEDIEKNLKKEARYFCYPTGGFNEKVVKIVKEAGFKGACTTNRGFDRNDKNVYEIKRIKVMNKHFHYWIQLSGYYDLLRGTKRGY